MKSQYRVQGVAVDKYSAGDQSDKPPIIMVHGGDHGSWCWEKWADFFCKAGYEVHVLNWYNHGDSDSLPEEEFIKRSITDVADKELRTVAESLDRAPIIMGHSMGGLAAAIYATDAPAEKLVLIAPVMPAAVKADPVPLPIDYGKPFPVFPYEQSKQLFFTTLDDTEAKKYYQLLVPESPQAVHEATQWSVALDTTLLTAPSLILGVELDQLVKPQALKRYAELINAKYSELKGIGHSDILLKEPDWREAASRVLDWLQTS